MTGKRDHNTQTRVDSQQSRIGWLPGAIGRRHIATASTIFLAATIVLQAHSLSVSAETTAAPATQPAQSSDADARTTTMLTTSGKFGKLESDLELARKGKMRAREADLLEEIALAYVDRHDYKAGEVLLRECLAIRKTLKDSEVQNLGMNVTSEDVKASDLVANAYSHLIMTLVNARRFENARTVCDEALAFARSVNSKNYEFECLRLTGECWYAEWNFEKAQTYYQQAFDYAVKENMPLNQAMALVNLSQVARGRQDYKAALDVLIKANAIIDAEGAKLKEQAKGKVKVSDGKGNSQDQGSEEYFTDNAGPVLTETARCYADLEMYDEAIKYYRRAAKHYKETFMDGIREGRALTSIGSLLLAQHKVQEASVILKEAYDIILESQEEHGETALIDCCIQYGAAVSELGDFERAKELHAKATETAFKIGDATRAVLATSSEGHDEFLQGNYEAALNKWFNALRLCDQDKIFDKDAKAKTLADIGMCFRSVGQNMAAIKYYMEAAQAYKKVGDVAGEAICLNSIAVAYLDSYQGALFDKFYKQARDLLKSGGNKRSNAYLTYNYGQHCMMQGKVDDALQSYEEALAAFKEVDDPLQQSRVLSAIGLVYLSMNRPQRAQEYYEKAQQIADKVGNLEARWDSATGLGKASKAQNDLPKAERYFRDAISLIEKERGQLSRDAFKTYSLDLRSDSFSDLIEILVANKEYDAALEMAEKGRARAFLDLLEGRSRGKMPSKAVAMVSSTFGDDPSAEKIVDKPPMIAMALPSESGFRSVEVLPRATSAIEASAISPINATPPTTAEIKSLVSKSKTCVIEYFTVNDKLYTWVVKPDGQTIMAEPAKVEAQDLSKKIADANKLITTTPKNIEEMRQLEKTRQAALKDLYNILVKPIEEHLPKAPEEVVTFVPHKDLFAVPFAALIAPNNKYLIEDHTLAYIPAIGVLRATQKISESVGDKNNLLAFGNPITKEISFLGTLPYSEKEVKKVSELFGPGNSTLEIGEKATKKAFNSQAPSHAVIHLATHGLIDQEHPMDSALVLAPEAKDDGLLTVKDILQMPPMHAKLVVLSACQTGKGKITGDGVVGLSRAFIIAGTPAVVVSQWNVDDVMTEYQMEHFYRAYLSGQSRAKALRDAQVKIIAFMEKKTGADAAATATNSEKIRANPRYWAAFQLIGEPN